MRLPLYLQHLLPADVGVIVDGHDIGPHVEAHIVAVEGGAQAIRSCSHALSSSFSPARKMSPAPTVSIRSPGWAKEASVSVTLSRLEQ